MCVQGTWKPHRGEKNITRGRCSGQCGPSGVGTLGDSVDQLLRSASAVEAGRRTDTASSSGRTDGFPSSPKMSTQPPIHWARAVLFLGGGGKAAGKNV